MSKELVLNIYWNIGLVAIGVSVLVLALSPIVKRWMHLDTLDDHNVSDDLAGQSQAGIEAHEAGVHPATRNT